MLLSYTIVDFHLFNDGAVDIQIWAPPTRSQCKVCDTQVTVKACGPLVPDRIEKRLYMVYVHVTVYSGQKCKWNNLNFMIFIKSALLDKRDL